MNHKPAGNYRGNLPGYVGAGRLHDKHVARVFFHSQFLHDPRGHGESGNTSRPHHRVDFFVQKQIQRFGKKHSAYCVKNECGQADSHDQQSIHTDKIFCLHTERNGDSKNQGNQVGKGGLGSFRKGTENAAFPDKVAEHEKTYQSYR